MSRTRREIDSLGELQVQSEAYYGTQTVRAINNFAISGIPISHLSQLVQALAPVKKAAILANKSLGDISAPKANAIVTACDDIAAGGLMTEFPIDAFQSGASTSTNMNVKEAIANRALDYLGLPRGRHDIIHSNDDVNLSQSTNDGYPTAIHVAILLSLRSLHQELRLVAENKGGEFASVLKLGRIQLQDAVPMTLRSCSFATAMREDVAHQEELVRLFQEVKYRGTAIGTGIRCDAAQAHLV